MGTGYVGLVAGAGLSDMGNEVTCVDIDAARIARLKRGELPIYEPGLDRLLGHNLDEGRLVFTTDVRQAVDGAAVVMIPVGTPPADDGSADLSQVLPAPAGIRRPPTSLR